jgi:formylglycine-generating enzyme required for sulfatase activity
MNQIFRPTLAVIFIFVVLVTPSIVFAEKRLALVIGNSKYQHVPRLANPANDASDMAQRLQGLGFGVTRGLDQDQQGLRRLLQEFARTSAGADMAVVFYAGHGMEVDGRNWLVPVDARMQSDVDVEFEAVGLELAMRAVSGARGLGLVILDSCRDNPFANAMQRGGTTRSVGRGMGRIEPHGGILVAYAARDGTVAADGDGRNSPYTEAMLDALNQPGLEIGLFFRHVRDRVLDRTGKRQEPFTYGSLPSTAIFLHPPTAEATHDITTQRARLEAEIAAQQERLELAKLTELEEKRLRLKAELREMKEKQRGPSPGDTWTEPHTGMEFVWVPGGCFEMGCGEWTDQCLDDEKPVHEVCVDGFWMGRYEVTQGQWQKVMGNNRSSFKKGDNYPVEMVSWNMTQDYIRRLDSQSPASGFRLPTEAEWEYACRGGGRKEKYCGGNDVNSVAWYSGNSSGTAHPVGRKQPNALGIYDMSGNVYEWVQDVWDENAYSLSGRRDNPLVSGGGSNRVLRGGSSLYTSRDVRAANRGRNYPSPLGNALGWGNSLGFRLLRTQ